MVTMSQDDDIEEGYLTCSICYDVFTEPKTLTCLHRFCEKCLQGYLVGQHDLAGKKGFLCPVCREPCPSPNPRRPPSDWAGLLKTDFHLKNLIKALRAGNEKRGRPKEGVNHPCSVHGDKEQDLYCVDCAESICHLCAGISHRGCSHVITLKDAALDRRATFDLQQRDLSRRLLQAHHLREQIDSAMEDFSRQRSRAEGAIREASRAALTLVQRRETEQVEELAKKFESVRGAVAKRLLGVDRQISACEQVLETAAAKVASASDVDMIKSLSGVLGEDALNFDMEKMEAFLTRLQSIRLEFVASRDLDLHLGDVVVRVDGEDSSPTTSSSGTKPAFASEQAARKARTATVSVMPANIPTRTGSYDNNSRNLQRNTSTQNTSSPHFHGNRPPVPPKRQRARTMVTMETNVDGDPVRVRTISGKFREDEESPALRDVVVVGTAADKVVLATDWANQCVKAFYRRKDRDSRLSLGGKPWCLAKVSDVQVAVSLPLTRQICLLKVLPRLALQSSFFPQKKYSGLAALGADALVASGGSDPPCVDIINLGGDVLRSFSQDPSTSRDLFSYPGYLAITPNKNRFLVSDRRKSALISLDTSGHVVFCFRPQGNKSLQEPCGVCCDAFGRVYLAESRGVARLTPQGVFDRPLLRNQDGVEEPKGIDVDEEGQLYVTSGEEDIVVFRVS